MRTDNLMINGDSETIAAFNRAVTVKAAAALTLVFSFAAIAATAPAHASLDRVSVEFSAVSSSELLIDKHDFINSQRPEEAASGAIELERLFWMCDYAATAGTLQDNEIEMCGAATEQLKVSRFDGDSDELLAWWRASKEAEHQTLLGIRVIGSCARDA
ncbi:MAG: hypothetical protein ACXW16_00045 [Burkholderiaceae bacterium]